MAIDDGEHTSFPCLATVRSLLAAVVTVLAVVVVVMVVVVVHRPEEINLSIGGGYVQTEQVWWKEMVRHEEVTFPTHSTQVTQIDHDPFDTSSADKNGRRVRGNTRAMTVPAGQPGVDVQPTGVGVVPVELGHDDGSFSVDVRWFERAKDPVTLQVTWRAHNPSGRGKVDGNVTAIRVLDYMPVNASSTGKELGRGEPSAEHPLRFSVPPQSSYTNKQWVTIRDNDSLQYLFDHYKGKNSFKAMVLVSTNITSKARLSWATGHSVDHYCGPVDVVYGTPDSRPDGQVTCNMQSSTTAAYLQPPAPAPAPTG